MVALEGHEGRHHKLQRLDTSHIFSSLACSVFPHLCFAHASSPPGSSPGQPGQRELHHAALLEAQTALQELLQPGRAPAKSSGALLLRLELLPCPAK